MKIAYIMSRFPLLSETFILREMIEVEKQGHTIALYPLFCEKHPVVHEEAQRWISRANCIPVLSREIFIENLRALLRNPLQYGSLIIQIILGNISSLEFLFKSLYLFPKAVYTAQRLRAEGVDHIHAHYASHPALVTWVIHKLTGLPYSLTIHSHDIYDCHAFLGPKLREAEFLAPISLYNIEYLAQLLGDWVRAKSRVVHCGIDLTRYNSSPSRSRGKVFEILQIGTLHWKKDQVNLVRAMAKLRDHNPRFRLRIIGEGGERLAITAEIKKLQLEGWVELLGAKTQAEVAELLQSADCYVQSSVSEGIPVSIMEAMATCLPVVSTNITGIPELVLEGKTGFLVPPADPQALADAIHKIWVDPGLAASMGQCGRQWVEQEFELGQNARKLVKLIDELR